MNYIPYSSILTTAQVAFVCNVGQNRASVCVCVCVCERERESFLVLFGLVFVVLFDIVFLAADVLLSYCRMRFYILF